MKPDVIEKLGASTIQHGKYNDRIYLMKLGTHDVKNVPKRLLTMAQGKGYSKVFAKVPEGAAPPFTEAGYDVEAKVPGFYNGGTSALFLSRFLAKDRRRSKSIERNARVMAVCKAKAVEEVSVCLPDSFLCRQCLESDVEAMANLYSEVFATYPFPIQDREYIRETMRTHVIYFGIWSKGRLLALSSAEMDQNVRNVEMTDFATLPECRGMGFATILLHRMEEAMTRRNMATAYTIARSRSFGMNIAFARMGYRMSGRLINNTNISGGFEDMNVWHKPIASSDEVPPNPATAHSV